MQESVFTKIINGQLPAQIIYQNEQTLAFLSIEPVQEGMLVIIPKQQIDNFEDLPDDLASAVILTTKKMMRLLRKTYPEAKKIAVQVEGFEVPHAHIKIFPIQNGADFHAPPAKTPLSVEQLAPIADKLRGNL